MSATTQAGHLHDVHTEAHGHELNFWQKYIFSTDHKVIGGVIMFGSFFIPGGAAKSGWTSYSPLATLAERGILVNGQTLWIIGMVCLIPSSLLGAVNFIATIIQLRAPGMTWMRLPFFCWAQFVTAFLLLLAFPPLEAAGVMQFMDKRVHNSFFLPTGLPLNGNLA